MDVHVCGCDMDACDETKCTAKGRVWTPQCPTHCDPEVCAAGMVKEEETPEPMNILDTLEENGSFGTLIGAIDAAGLTDTLKGEGPFTLIAPTDTAFSSIAVPTDMDVLKKLLLNHVAGEMVTSTDASFIMLGGENAKVNIEGNTLDINGSPIKMDYFDVIASNGIIHGVEKVLAFTSDEEEKLSPQKEEVKEEVKEEEKVMMDSQNDKGEDKPDEKYSSAVSFEVLHYSTLLCAFVASAFVL